MEIWENKHILLPKAPYNLTQNTFTLQQCKTMAYFHNTDKFIAKPYNKTYMEFANFKYIKPVKWEWEQGSQKKEFWSSIMEDVLGPVICHMSLVKRKPVFGVCNKDRLKPACATTDTSWTLEISDIETRGIILSRQRTRKVLIRLQMRFCCSHMA